MRLSILICSLHDRAAALGRLLARLQPQVTPEVEILTNIDNREKTIGVKRNELVAQAHGDYIAFVDDDDLVAEDYVQQILLAIASNPDCCGIEGVITFGGQNPQRFVHSIKHTWCEIDHVYYRSPNHLNPIKRELALQVKFPEINFGEDKAYSDKILPLLKTESYISNPIYFYLFSKPKHVRQPQKAMLNHPQPRPYQPKSRSVVAIRQQFPTPFLKLKPKHP